MSAMNENNGPIEIPLAQSQIANIVFTDDLVKDEEAGDKMATAWSALTEMRFN